ncbi:hypothetical protein VTO73DRAFT_10257 [Trametes versicolor]
MPRAPRRKADRRAWPHKLPRRVADLFLQRLLKQDVAGAGSEEPDNWSDVRVEMGIYVTCHQNGWGPGGALVSTTRLNFITKPAILHVRRLVCDLDIYRPSDGNLPPRWFSEVDAPQSHPLWSTRSLGWLRRNSNNKQELCSHPPSPSDVDYYSSEADDSDDDAPATGDATATAGGDSPPSGQDTPPTPPSPSSSSTPSSIRVRQTSEEVRQSISVL